MAYGFSTTTTANGFKWTVTRTVWDADAAHAVTETIKEGVTNTRAKATGAAKRWVLFFRKGGVL